MRTVYIEKNEATNEFATVNNYSSWEGFTLLGYHVEPFFYKNMDYLSLDKETVVHGYIKSVEKAITILGCNVPEEVSIPEELTEFAGRKMWVTTLGEIRQNEPLVFIKPLRGHKTFDGHVRNGMMANLMQTAMCPNNTEVLASEIVKFTTEYRGFVLNKELIGWKHYKGDFSKMPNVNVVKEAISKYKSAPVAYSIDFGLDDKDQSLLIEVNDAYSLGSYGLSSILYARMIEARWDEIVNL